MREIEIEREINLYDMFWYICLKWRFIVISAIFGGIILGIVGLALNINTKIITSDDVFDAHLSFKELSLADQNRINQYFYLEEMYKKVRDNNIKDKLLTLDYTNTYKTEIEYLVKESKNGVLIANLLSTKLKSMWERNRDINKFNTISIHYQQDYVIRNIGEEDYKKEVLILITVYGETETECLQNIEKINIIMEESRQDAVIKFGEYQLLKNINEVYKAECPSLNDYINQKKTSEYNMLNSKTSLTSSFTETVKKYIENYNASMDIENIDKLDQTLDSEEKIQSLIINLNIKYILIGVVLGIISCVGFYFIKYLFNEKLRYEDDIESTHGISLIGRISLEQKLSTIDKFILDIRRKDIHKFEYSEIIQIIASEIKVKSRQLNLTEIYVTGSILNDYQSNIIKDINRSLVNTGVQLKDGKPILYYADALEESAEIGNILMIEKCNKTHYKEIEQQIKKAEERGLNILGIVILE